MGHCTYLAVVQRAALATFHDVYSFIRKGHHTRANMWPSMRWDLDILCGLLPLLLSDWHGIRERCE